MTEIATLGTTLQRLAAAALSERAQDLSRLRQYCRSLLEQPAVRALWGDLLGHLALAAPNTPEGDACLKLIDDTFCEVVTAQPVLSNEAAGKVGHLVGMPLVVTQPSEAVGTVFDEESCAALTAEMRKHMEDECEIQLLPVLLEALEAVALDHPTLWAIHEALAQSKVQMALDTVRAAISRNVEARRIEPNPSEPTKTVGVVLAFARTKNADPFALATQLDIAETTQSKELQEAVDAVLDTGSAELGIRVTCWEQVGIIEPLDWWFFAVEAAQMLDRELLASERLDACRISVQLEVGESLVAHPEEPTAPEDASGFRLAVSRSRDGSVVGFLAWPFLRGEDADEAQEALYAFLEDNQVLPVEVLEHEINNGSTVH